MAGLVFFWNQGAAAEEEQEQEQTGLTGTAGETVLTKRAPRHEAPGTFTRERFDRLFAEWAAKEEEEKQQRRRKKRKARDRKARERERRLAEIRAEARRTLEALAGQPLPAMPNIGAVEAWLAEQQRNASLRMLDDIEDEEEVEMLLLAA